jgi:iron complex outermembrane receptor protein
LSGRVAGENGAPLPQVEVTILEVSRTTTTDSTGRFVFPELAPGDYTIRFRRLGFASETFTLALSKGESKDVSVVLSARPYALPDIDVKGQLVKPVEYGYTHKYDDFFLRKKVGLGGYLTRADIERLRPLDTPRLVSLVPGVVLFFSDAQNVDVKIRSCETIGVWIDGAKQRSPEFYRRWRNQRDMAAIAAGYFLSRILPSQIELVEVYRGPAEMPAEFLPDECAIVIWTRS